MILTKDKSITDLIKYYMGMISICLMALAFPSDANAKTDQGICDLKVLSLLIAKQTNAVFSTGSPEAIKALKNSQQELKQALALLYKKNPNNSGASQIFEDGRVLSANIDLLVQHQDSLKNLHLLQLQVSDVVPEIQAEYNLMVDQMSRNNYPASEVVIAKNQVFIAERMMRSLININANNKEAKNGLDDLSADLEIFNTYLKAQLEGSTDFGVKKIKDKELREALITIQHDTDEVLNKQAMQLLSKPQLLYSLLDAAQDNISRSDNLFERLLWLESISN